MYEPNFLVQELVHRNAQISDCVIYLLRGLVIQTVYLIDCIVKFFSRMWVRRFELGEFGMHQLLVNLMISILEHECISRGEPVIDEDKLLLLVLNDSVKSLHDSGRSLLRTLSSPFFFLGCSSTLHLFNHLAITAVPSQWRVFFAFFINNYRRVIRWIATAFTAITTATADSLLTTWVTGVDLKSLPILLRQRLSGIVLWV